MAMVALSDPVRGQLLTNSGASIAVQSGAQLTVQGDVLNAGTGSITNSGTIDLSGNWTNDASNDCFGSSEGTVIMNGTGQQIGGSGYTQFNHLQLTGGDVTLMQDAYVGGGAMSSRTGVLALNASRLLLNSRLLGLTNSDPTAVSRTTGFLVSETGPAPGYGRVNWFLGDHAPAFYTVPFGNASTNDYLPLDMNLLVAGSGTSGWYTFATYPTDPFALPNNRPLPTGMGSFTDLAGVENAHNVVDRFWIIDADEYAAEPTVRFTFTYRDSEWNTGTNTIAEATLQAQQWDGALWINPPTGSVNTVNNTVGSLPLSQAGQAWVLVQGFTPLPVELLSFSAKRINDREVQLDWSTATEHDNAGFEVWRMIEGEEDFTRVGWVNGAGNSLQLLTYASLDDNASAEISYYKLKQVDTGGQYEWSLAVAVEGAGHAAQFMAHPNPARDVITLRGLPENTTMIAMHDASGRLVKQWSSTTMLTELGDLERGVYLLNALDADGGVLGVRVALE